MATWILDTQQSVLSFSVKQYLFSSIRGKFEQFEAFVVSKKTDFTDAQVSFKASVSSLNTHNQDRDKRLQSPEFFDAELFPYITFVSSSFRKIGGTHYQMSGLLTVRNFQRHIRLDVDFNGFRQDYDQNNYAVFEVVGQLDRKDFGLDSEDLLTLNGMLIGDLVRLQANLVFAKRIAELQSQIFEQFADWQPRR